MVAFSVDQTSRAEVLFAAVGHHRLSAAPAGPILPMEQSAMPSQTLRIMCPNLTCRKVLAVPVAARGKTVRCRNCSTAIRIPQAGEKKPSAEPKPAA